MQPATASYRPTHSNVWYKKIKSPTTVKSFHTHTPILSSPHPPSPRPLSKPAVPAISHKNPSPKFTKPLKEAGVSPRNQPVLDCSTLPVYCTFIHTRSMYIHNHRSPVNAHSMLARQEYKVNVSLIHTAGIRYIVARGPVPTLLRSKAKRRGLNHPEETSNLPAPLFTSPISTSVYYCTAAGDFFIIISIRFARSDSTNRENLQSVGPKMFFRGTLSAVRPPCFGPFSTTAAPPYVPQIMSYAAHSKAGASSAAGAAVSAADPASVFVAS